MKDWREILGALLEKKADKRRSPRKRITFALKYRLSGGKSDNENNQDEYAYTLGTDISLIGLAIYGLKENFMPSTVLDFEFPFPESFNRVPLHFQGVVVHKRTTKKNKQFSYGIKFVNISDETLSILKETLKLEK